MPNTREKLIELLSKVQYLGGLEEKIADHLIANGITFATGNNFARQLIPMGAITYAVACSHCKNRGADAKKCDQCRCEVKSWFEFDPATVQQWISVKDEKKPKDRRNYFIAYVFGDSDMRFFGEAKYYAYEGNGIVDRPHFSNEGVGGMRVTHWMEIPKLPQPPKGE